MSLNIFYICLIAFLAFLIIYVFFLYKYLLQLLVTLSPPRQFQYASNKPQVTVLLTVYNEQKNIINRIENILTSSYDKNLLKILVASDGSTDETEKLVKEFSHPQVTLFSSLSGEGKSKTQNEAIRKIDSEIIIFTDAESEFHFDFIHNISRVFSDPSIGGATGRLFFRTSDTGISNNQGYYWNYETKLRQLESHLGLLAVGSGACLAIREKLFVPLANSVGEDCIIPLDIVSQGYQMVHVEDAIAYDTMEFEIRSEVKSRIRMTLRNWQGTMSRGHLLNPFKNFKYSFALFSHKILRWLSPYILLAILSLFLLLWIQNPHFIWIPFLIISYLFLSLLGYYLEVKNKNMLIVSTLFSFTLANIGFLIGVYKGTIGEKITKYRE